MYVLHWFDRATSASPDAFAIVCEGRRISYGELDATAGHIAYGLEQAGVGNGDLVAVLLDRSPAMIAALLGIWKVGAACIPIDASLPSARIAFMLEDAGAHFLLTRGKLADGLAAGGMPDARMLDVRMLDLDVLCAASGSFIVAPGAGSPDALAYVVYTSGSTGKPKGVRITHGGLANTVDSVRDDLALTQKDVVLAWTTLAFDAAFLEICLPLVCGATLYLVEEQLADGGSRVEQVRRSAATVILGTPTLYRLLLEEGWQGDPRMQIIAGGEALSLELARKLAGMCRTLWNQYGPTEASICATRARISVDAENVTIGQALPNVSVHLLDADFRPVARGSVGEIYIGGAGVALGYLNRPELTRTSFFPDPFATGVRGWLYKSGDLALQRVDGNYTFVGRADSQVKLRGFRIELDEIQAALQSCVGVRTAVVRVLELEPGDQRLIAFVLCDRKDTSACAALWRQALSDRLPAYMVPSEFIALSHFPTTLGGKVDLRSLDALRLGPPVLPPEREVSARDDVEAWLHSTWQRLLKRKAFGIHDDFFSLGGHSLLAARMLAQVEDRFGCKVPHAVLGEAPTILGLADYIREATATPWPEVVTLQAGTQRLPLFIAHGIGGSVLSFKELARELGREHPVYGFQLPVVMDPRDAELSRIAAIYLRQVRTLQPYGPYQFAGHSSGGLVVFEMACQLIAQGETVALLALLDCDPDVGKTPRSPFRNWRLLGAACTRTLARFHLGEVSVRQWLRRRLDHRRIQRRIGLARRARREGGEVGSAVRAEGHLGLAMSEYDLKLYPGKITLFVAHDEPRADAGPAEAWAARAAEGAIGNCEMLPVRGTHLTMLNRPNVASLARDLRQRMRQAVPLEVDNSEMTQVTLA
jgi:amino acid adenylation domain-containing protein